MTSMNKLSHNPQVTDMEIGHLQRAEDLPKFRAVLEMWPEEKSRALSQERIAVLDVQANVIAMVATLGVNLSSDWFHILDRLERDGKTPRMFFTAEPIVFEILEYHIDTTHEEIATKAVSGIDLIIAESKPLNHFVDMVGRAIEIGASDAHVEIRGDYALLNARVGGIVRRIGRYPAQIVIDAVSAAFTVQAEELSRSDAAFNARLPQQAMIPIRNKDRDYTLRYQSHPSVGGFDVVLRILRSSAGSSSKVKTLPELGYLPSQVEQLDLAMQSAWGGVFVAGVTGSGKTTTLNSMLSLMAAGGERKIISIEDPVEYIVPGVTHLSVQRTNAIGVENPFLNAMRAFLRLDPDIGMFGEIRDLLSGEIAQAAIETGHKIFTTVHATSALGIISRLTSKMVGLDRQAVCNPEFLSILVYQALLPKNCPYCKTPAKLRLPADELTDYETLFGLDVDQIMCASDGGCAHCRIPGVDYSALVHAGTRGVCVTAEVITPDSALLRLLVAERDLDARDYYRATRVAPFDAPDMQGKDAWGHALYSVAQGLIDPYYFKSTFGHPKGFRQIVQKGMP
ncbi:MAG: Toxin coregulated pilus biosynthesis protein T [Herbaspirillum frisingense]|uniref:Toxin coregulated pilus biosynthesis protein T n=1 Tax=Herbaspirillum frisingense TaxID=92645 RepID=A0A7V8FTF5_9BURK|nr:MAG: Toxin coregulated pilus biosynthesis protein T [Herbaspirillum frisingense]